VLIAQPGEQLGQQERLAVGPGKHLPQRFIRLAAQHVVRDLRDRGLIKGAQPDLGRARRFQSANRFPRDLRQLTIAQRKQPADPVRGQPPGQRGHRTGGRRVRPLQVRQ
jgi:hypothetical protein